MISNRNSAAIVFIISIVSICYLVTNIRYANTADIETAFEEARQQVIDTYVSIAVAEDAGAEISELIVTLKEQIRILTQVEEKIKQNDIEQAFHQISLVVSSCKAIVEKATLAEEEAKQASANVMIWTRLAIPVTAVLSGMVYYFLSVIWHKHKLKRIRDKEIDYNEY